MASKLLFVVLAAFCLHQLAPASAATINYTAIIETYVKDVEEAVSEVTTEVESVIKSVEEKVNETVTALIKTWKEDLATAEAALKNVVSNFTECESNQTTSLLDIGISLVNTTVTCVWDEYADELKAINTSVAALETAAAAAIKEIETCDNDTTVVAAALCLLENLPSDVSTIATDAVAIYTEIAEVVTLVEDWESILETCFETGVSSAAEKAVTFISETISCIEESV